jgi:hypothetical protein
MFLKSLFTLMLINVSTFIFSQNTLSNSSSIVASSEEVLVEYMIEEHFIYHQIKKGLVENVYYSENNECFLVFKSVNSALNNLNESGFGSCSTSKIYILSLEGIESSFKIFLNKENGSFEVVK